MEIKDELIKADRRMDRLEAELKPMKWMIGLTLAGVAGIVTLLARLLASLTH